MRKALVLVLALTAAIASAKDFTLTILHTNDLHARVEPAKVKNGTYGGYARQATLIRKFMASDENPILVNAGDTFQGTLYFSLYNGLADLAFMNRVGYQAMAVGNHEFDLGDRPLAEFAKRANFPMLAANLDVTKSPDLNGLIKPSTVLTVGGQRIGIVGAVTADLPSLASPSENVKMLPLVPSVQSAVDALSKQGINKIILLSHCGTNVDLEIAKQLKNVDVIVSAHSHTLLGDIRDPNLPASEGPYPLVVKQGQATTLVVSAWQWGKVLGRIKVSFNDRGEITGFRDAAPVIVDGTVGEDPEMATLVAAFSKPLEAYRKQVVATLDRAFDGSREAIRRGDSPMGNAIADAMLAAGKRTGAVLAIMNSGGVRTGLDTGPVTIEEVLAVQPFGNTLTILDVTGAELVAALEHGADGWPNEGRFPYVSENVRVTYDMTKPVGQRLQGATVDGQAIDPAKTYRIAINSFTAKGGDGYTMFAEAKGARVDTGLIDADVLVEFLRAAKGFDSLTAKRVTIRS